MYKPEIMIVIALDFMKYGLKSRRSNVKIWLQFTVYTTKIVFFTALQGAYMP